MATKSYLYQFWSLFLVFVTVFVPIPCKMTIFGTNIAKLTYTQGPKVVILLDIETKNVSRTSNRDQIAKYNFWHHTLFTKESRSVIGFAFEISNKENPCLDLRVYACITLYIPTSKVKTHFYFLW